MAHRDLSVGDQEHVHIHRIDTGLGNVTLMHARYLTQVFAPHFHECYCLGVIEAGALEFRYRGENLVAPAGAVNLAVPGEVHTGQAADDTGWRYRMLYLDSDLLAGVAAQMAGRPAGMPFIRAGVLFDHDLARQIHRLHRCMTETTAGQLEKETLLIEVLSRLIQRHGQPRARAAATADAPDAVNTTRAYIHACYEQDLSVRDLAAATGLSPYHLIRIFHRQVGLTPHAYLTQVRVRNAQRLLLSGESLAQAAIDAGFYDQSHLTRHFKRITGITPGRYRNSVQDSSRR